MNKSLVNPGGSFTTKDRETLGLYKHHGLMRYKDLEAGYCIACGTVYGVSCPNCKAEAGAHGRHDDSLFIVNRPLESDRYQGQEWTLTQCRKCDYKFKVLVQPLHGVGE